MRSAVTLTTASAGLEISLLGMKERERGKCNQRDKPRRRFQSGSIFLDNIVKKEMNERHPITPSGNLSGTNCQHLEYWVLKSNVYCSAERRRTWTQFKISPKHAPSGSVPLQTLGLALIGSSTSHLTVASEAKILLCLALSQCNLYWAHFGCLRLYVYEGLDTIWFRTENQLIISFYNLQ